MRYVIADKSKAIIAGIDFRGHRTKGMMILINEKEVEFCLQNTDLTFEQKVTRMNGTIYTEEEVLRQLEQGGLNNG